MKHAPRFVTDVETVFCRFLSSSWRTFSHVPVGRICIASANVTWAVQARHGGRAAEPQWVGVAGRREEGRKRNRGVGSGERDRSHVSVPPTLRGVCSPASGCPVFPAASGCEVLKTDIVCL